MKHHLKPIHWNIVNSLSKILDHMTKEPKALQLRTFICAVLARNPSLFNRSYRFSSLFNKEKILFEVLFNKQRANKPKCNNEEHQHLLNNLTKRSRIQHGCVPVFEGFVVGVWGVCVCVCSCNGSPTHDFTDDVIHWPEHRWTQTDEMTHFTRILLALL